MRIDVLTLFPEMFQGPLNESLLKKALDKGLLSFNIVNIRDFASDKHKTADDTPYGGGAGMVMKIDVAAKALKSLGRREKHRIIYLCPTGLPLTQPKVNELANFQNLTLVCGHYEGIDARLERLVDEKISIGDYVLTGGEIPAMVLIDAVARQLPGVVKEAASVENDSFYGELLDYLAYTKPEDFEGEKVPEVLLSGNHAQIERWRRKEALRRTFYQRPELLASLEPRAADKELINEILTNG
ncbi:MAG: tRNA (guanosine(37)-N1)-methyltransferase TrmD [Candidatus Saganbacteria bacterium]|nr:tRNA (guanosine(37)-N1)-methyltransferase TrmD [Candidatus Saganbacteria bacterium]